MSAWTRTGVALAALAMSAAGSAAQEETTNRVAANTDWSVFVEDNPRECWGVSAPRETVNTRDGRVVQVRRGDILLSVTFRPDSGASGEVSFTGGYPFASGSTVQVEIGDQEFQMFTDGEWAWPENPEADAQIVEAMKNGTDATLTAVSSRGTTTSDTFSLMGFTAAIEDAEERCAQ